MENKYQEALNRIKEFHKNFICTTTKDESWYIKYYDLATLQELIDNQTKLEERLIEQDELCKEEMKEMAECIERFEKALDKAIEILIDIDSDIYKMTEKEWKEYLLSEVSK